MKTSTKVVWGGVLAGIASGLVYLTTTKKGKAIRDELKKNIPQILKEIETRCASGKQTFDEVVEEVVGEWDNARKLMKETIAPLKREIKRRQRKL